MRREFRVCGVVGRFLAEGSFELVDIVVDEMSRGGVFVIVGVLMRLGLHGFDKFSHYVRRVISSAHTTFDVFANSLAVASVPWCPISMASFAEAESARILER